MSKKVVRFEYEKETKNSVRYKEVPEDGTAPIVGSLYVQKWFAGIAKHLKSPSTRKTNQSHQNTVAVSAGLREQVVLTLWFYQCCFISA